MVAYLQTCFLLFFIYFQLVLSLGHFLAMSVLPHTFRKNCFTTFDKWHGEPSCITIMHWWIFIWISWVCFINSTYLEPFIVVPGGKKLQSSSTKAGKYLLHHLAWRVFHGENVSFLLNIFPTGLLMFFFLTANCCRFEKITLDQPSYVHGLFSYLNVRISELLRGVSLGFQVSL